MQFTNIFQLRCSNLLCTHLLRRSLTFLILWCITSFNHILVGYKSFITMQRGLTLTHRSHHIYRYTRLFSIESPQTLRPIRSAPTMLLEHVPMKRKIGERSVTAAAPFLWIDYHRNWDVSLIILFLGNSKIPTYLCNIFRELSYSSRYLILICLY